LIEATSCCGLPEIASSSSPGKPNPVGRCMRRDSAPSSSFRAPSGISSGISSRVLCCYPPSAVSSRIGQPACLLQVDRSIVPPLAPSAIRHRPGRVARVCADGWALMGCVGRRQPIPCSAHPRRLSLSPPQFPIPSRCTTPAPPPPRGHFRAWGVPRECTSVYLAHEKGGLLGWTWGAHKRLALPVSGKHTHFD
jgi:hypothetical protein